jgi:4,5-dihydroxyphthalate decarboxylase
MHALGIRRDIHDKNRWLAASLYKAFLQAKRLADAEFVETTALKIGLPWVTAEYEATTDAMGADFWSYGVAPNYKTLSTMARYSYEQGLAVRLLTVEEMFAEGNLSEARV